MKNLLSIFCAVLFSLTVASTSAAAPAGSGEVVIINSGNRLTPGYQAAVEPDGSLTAVLIPFGRHKPIHSADKMSSSLQQRFFADLAAAEPLDRLAVSSAIVQVKPRQRPGRRRQTGANAGAVFGTRVFVRYQGRQSPDLRKARSAAGRLLYQDVKQVLFILRLPIPNIP